LAIRHPYVFPIHFIHAHPIRSFFNTIYFTGVPNTAIFAFLKEDHTLGNLLTSRLHSYPTVTFAAYIVPHPLFANFDLRVTTDGSISPKEALLTACKDLVSDLSALSNEFTKEIELNKIANMRERQ